MRRLVHLLPLLAAVITVSIAYTHAFSDAEQGKEPMNVISVLCKTGDGEFSIPFDIPPTDLSSAVLEIDAHTHVRVTSQPIPIPSLVTYNFSYKVKRISGQGIYNCILEWLDDEHGHLGYEYASVTELVGTDWKQESIEAIAPEAARFARVVVQSEPGRTFLIRDIVLEAAPTHSADLSIDLIPSQITGPDIPFNLRVRLENRGEIKLHNIQTQISLPDGLKTEENRNLEAGDLSYAQVYTHDLMLVGYPADETAEIICTVKADMDTGEIEFVQSTLPFITTAREETVLTSDLPEPELPPMDVKLGTYYFPVMLDWDRSNWGVRRVDYLNPKLGYYDESLPEVADWHIFWAVQHGISFFVFDWYYNQDFFYLNDALEKGFLNSRFADKMQFCIDWCNEGHGTEFKPLDFSHKSLEGFIRTLCERYFHRDNYLRVDDKPVVIIHVPTRIANAHGGWGGCRIALDRMRAIAREYGHPGVYFVALQNNKPFLLDYARGGFDAVTAYAYGFRDVQWDPETRSLPFEALIPRHKESFAIAQGQAHARGMDYIPSAWVGWDDYARSKERAVRTKGNTPEAFRRMIEMLPEYADRTGLVLFESWNEWGEGGHVEPEEHYGFGRLSAIRDVITRARGLYTTYVPAQQEVDRFNTDVTWDEVNDMYYDRYARSLELEKGFRMDFQTVHDLWLRPIGGIRGARVDSGLLIAESTSNDPIFLGPPMMNISAEQIIAVDLRMQVLGGREGQLFWLTEDKRGWAEERSIRFPLKTDGQFHDYRIHLKDHPEWTGTIRQFRFDPTNAPGSITIEYFATVDGP